MEGWSFILKAGEVFLEARKWPDTPHWRMHLDVLGRDDYGTWLGRKPPLQVDGPQGPVQFTHTFVVLLPEAEWWIPTHYADHDEVEVYVDVSMPAEWLSDRHVTAVDLDLDVIRFRDGRTILDDEDEFAEHQVSLGYPKDVIENAVETSRWLMEAVEQRREPFGDAGKRYLDMLT